MTVELSLILLLLLCVVSLSILLFSRVKAEKKHQVLFQNFSMNELSDFMKKNSLDGSISVVARLFSDILKRTFRCEYIIFLRKKRNVLELNYYHGINAFNRNDFRLEHSPELKKVLKDDYFPRDISAIERFLPSKFKAKLVKFNMDKFFPVFWRDNLYGFYVIKSNPATNSGSFRVVIAQLVLSLAAAYHIKWHESKLNQIQENNDGTKISTKVTEGGEQVERVLHFMKCKKTDVIIPQLVNSLRESNQVESLVFIYDTKDGETTELLFSGKQSLDLPPILSYELHSVVDIVTQKPTISISEILKQSSGNFVWVENLRQNNLNRIVSFPLSNKRKGLLAWNQSGDSTEISERIDCYKRYLIDIFENVEEMESLEELSYTDNLTSLSNRRYFYKRLHEELNRSERYGRKLALIIFDIDELKIINDTYGHQAGDEIISQIGSFLKKYIRTIDVVARYGGDEFCIIMPETDQETCMKFVERLHHKIQNSAIFLEQPKKSINCTISMGIAIYPDHAQNSKKLIYAADMALLKAKESGRNKAVLAVNSVEIE